MDDRGAVATLAVFALFIVALSVVVVYGFQASERRRVDVIQLAIASDTTRATASAIETELNETLRTAVTAAMYEAGARQENREQVEQRVRDFINDRISLGWSFSNLTINVPSSDENSLKLEWLPNGAVRAFGYLDAEFEHVIGTMAHGVKLDVTPPPRFQRVENVASYVVSVARYASDLVALQTELNENYACEGLRIDVWENAGKVVAKVTDTYGAKGVILS